MKPVRFPPLKLNFRSVRTRLMVWNVCALALILGILGGIIQFTVKTNLLTSVDRELEDRTHRPHGPPFDGGRMHGPPDGGMMNFASRLNEIVPPMPRFEPDHPSPPGDHGPGPDDRGPGLSKGMRFLDLQGKARNPFGTRPEDQSPLDRHAFEQLMKGNDARYYSTVTLQNQPVRVLSWPMRDDRGQIVGVIQAGYSLSEVNKALTGMNHTMLTLIPVALLLAGLGGALLTDRALRPVRNIALTAEEIGAHDLSRRLPTVGADEFSQLATTFNAMLSRLETAFIQKEALVDQLKGLIEQQQRFTGDASHELRTPLTVIKANTSLALQSEPDLAEYRESIADIDNAANTMTRLVQDLLLLTRADGGQSGRNATRLSVCDLLENAARSTRCAEAAPIIVQGIEPSLQIMGNSDEIGRLFSNLLENAARYTPQDGEIRVCAAQEGDGVRVQVSDTGCGIAPEHLPHLCERFYRVDASRTRPDGGSGLGLSICKSIVEAHEGTLAIDSAVGKGTTVSVTLPGRQRNVSPPQ